MKYETLRFEKMSISDAENVWDLNVISVYVVLPIVGEDSNLSSNP